mgnify:FL=1
MHFQIAEFVKTQLTITDIIAMSKQQLEVFPVEQIFCDPSEPGYIAELQKAKMPAVKAINDIRVGLDEHYDLIKTRRFKIFAGTSPHGEDEYSQYHYPEPEDLGPDQDAKEELPVDQYNHEMDAARYTSIMTKTLFKRAQPKLPQAEKTSLTLAEKLAKLKRLKHNQSENWS